MYNELGKSLFYYLLDIYFFSKTINKRKHTSKIKVGIAYVKPKAAPPPLFIYVVVETHAKGTISL